MSVIVRPAGAATGSAVVRLAMGGWPLRRSKSQPAAGQAKPVQVGIELRQPFSMEEGDRSTRPQQGVLRPSGVSVVLEDALIF